MDKLKMHSPNLTQENIARIRDLFPGCVTEAKGKDGSVTLAVDFDQLKQELAESITEGPQERYHLNWPGKREALLAANAPIAKTLRPNIKESLHFGETRNLFIEGDNLDGLKLLQESYLGKIKMIYITQEMILFTKMTSPKIHLLILRDQTRETKLALVLH